MTSPTLAQKVALDWHLSAYNADQTFEHICDQILEQSDSVTIWEVLENYPPEQVLEWIETLAAEVQDAVNKEKANDQTHA